MKKIHLNKKTFTCVGGGAIAVALALGMMPVAALAETGESEIATRAAETLLQNYNSYGDTVATADQTLQSDFSLTTYDLRHVGGETTYDATKKRSVMTGGKNYVTPVKNQTPWGTCWAFAAIAASETSLLTSSGQTYEEAVANGSSFADLSERHLAWFGRSYIKEDGQFSSQADEGAHLVATPETLAKRDMAIMNPGGTVFFATSIISNGTGPVPESYAPYQNNSGEKIENADGTWSYAMSGDWSVDDSLRFGSVAELVESRILPESANGDIAGVSAIKSELMAGNAVSITYHAERSTPDQTTTSTKYINTATWAHYTWNPKESANHAVTIVGWDDSYSKDNFYQGTTTVDDVEYDMAPQGDGAWIVKNSWGSTSGSGADYADWGDDGYFYLSYYDKSISGAETFVYDTSEEASLRSDYILDQYDLSESAQIGADSYDTEVRRANVFPNDNGTTVRLRDIGYITGTARDTVNLKVYVMDKEADVETYIANHSPNAEIDQFAEFKGYNRVALDTPVTIGTDEKYVIVQTTKQPSGKYELCYQASLGKNLITAVNKVIYEQAKIQGQLMYDTLYKADPARFDAMTDEQRAAFLQNCIDFFRLQAERSTYTKAVVNEGESLLYTEGAWEDWNVKIKEINASASKDIYDNGIPLGGIPAGTTIEDPYAIDNFGIKGYLDDSESVFRLYNAATNEHLWTTDENEYNVLVDYGWTQEGQAWRSAFDGVPVYRLYNAKTNTHHYTSDTNEVAVLTSKYGWKNECIAFYGYDADTEGVTAVNRLYSSGINQHLLTTDTNEVTVLSSRYGWTDEGQAFYVYAAKR